MQTYNLHANKKQPKVEVRNLLAPVHEFQLCAVGGTGTGKTNALMSMLINHMSFDRYYIYSKHIDDPKDVYVDPLIPFLDKTEKQLQKKLKDPDFKMLWCGDSYDDIPSVKEYDRNYKNILVVDDFMTDVVKKPEKLIEIFVSGRHQNLSVIFLVQRYNEIPPDIRGNTNYFCLFEMRNKLENMLIARDLAMGVSYDEFLKMYQEAVEERFSFFVIDKKTDIPMLRYRKKWDGIFTGIKNQ